MDRLGALRGLVYEAPSPERWDEICRLLDDWPGGHQLDAALDYAAHHLHRWPLGLRQTPPGWWRDHLQGIDQPRLGLCPHRPIWRTGQHGLSIQVWLHDLSVWGAGEDLRVALVDGAEPHMGCASLWLLGEGRLLHSLLDSEKTDEEVLATNFSLDGRRFCALMLDLHAWTIRGVVWEVATGRQVASFPVQREDVEGLEHQTLALSPDGARVALAERGGVRLLEVDSGTAKVLDDSGEEFWQVAWSANGRRLVAVASSGAMRVWHPGNASLDVTLDVGVEHAVALAFAHDGASLALGRDDGQLIWLELEGGALEERWRGTLTPGDQPGFLRMGLTRAGTLLAASLQTPTLELLGVGVAGERREVLQLEDDAIEAHTISADGRWLLTAGALRADLWTLEGWC